MDIEEKIKLLREVGEEIVTEEELVELFKTKKNPVAYDGFEPSGKIHIAQGLLRSTNVNKMTKAGIKMKFYVADWFAMLNNKLGGDMEKIRICGEYFIEVWKACGMDMENVEFIWASDLIKDSRYWEMVLKLSKNATISRVLRCSQIMGRSESVSNPSSQILYPLMQATDIYYLGVDIAQLGMDQRKVNMLARELFPKLGLKPPIAVHHHMLAGLAEPKVQEGLDEIDASIAKKMSKSNPDSAIFMTDSREEVERKIKKAFCPIKTEKDNPILEYSKYIIFERVKEFEIEREEKFGGNVTFSSYEELKNAYLREEIHPLDLKKAVAKKINDFLEPVRKHFKENKKARELLEKVNSF